MSLSALSSLPGVLPALASAKQSGVAAGGGSETAIAAEESKTPASAADAGSSGGANDPVLLSDEAKAIVRSLQARDQQVRAHEQAHLAASGGLATGGASYTYQKGPDGASYAIGGEVSIDVSAGRTPEDTIARAATIRAAAMAPADPSGQDRAVAAAASQMEQQARAELLIKASTALQEKVANAYQTSDDPTSRPNSNQDNLQSTRINAYA